MIVVHVIQSISPADGGPPSVVLHLAAAQAALATDVRVVTYSNSRNRQWWSEWTLRVPGLARVDLQEVSPKVFSSRNEVRELRKLHRVADIVHTHGIWRRLVWNSLSCQGSGGAVSVLAPHGMLSPWALAHRGFRKKLALMTGWRRLIGAADTLHAVSLGEQAEIRALIAAARVSVIPNGVSMTEAPDVITELNPRERYVLYLARLHEMKGPDRLVYAFAELLATGSELENCRLVLAGPDFGAQSALQAQVLRLGLQDKVVFPGGVYDAAKRSLYQRATLVCQPSRYEAFSLSLLEALAAGVPVVTTPEANFPEIQSRGAGIICSGEPHELTQSMLLILTNPELRAQMGERGKMLVRENYTWDRIAARALQTYTELRGDSVI
jgi:glycosyltransferase involved in cell wall biosynthesis